MFISGVTLSVYYKSVITACVYVILASLCVAAGLWYSISPLRTKQNKSHDVNYLDILENICHQYICGTSRRIPLTSSPSSPPPYLTLFSLTLSGKQREFQVQQHHCLYTPEVQLNRISNLRLFWY